MHKVLHRVVNYRYQQEIFIQKDNATSNTSFGRRYSWELVLYFQNNPWETGLQVRNGPR